MTACKILPVLESKSPADVFFRKSVHINPYSFTIYVTHAFAATAWHLAILQHVLQSTGCRTVPLTNRLVRFDLRAPVAFPSNSPHGEIARDYLGD